jgi:hypothetical protein
MARSSHWDGSKAMETGPSYETNNCFSSQQIPCLSWNPVKNPPLHSILSQINTLYVLPPHFLKIRNIFILARMTTTSKTYTFFRLGD